MTSFDKIRIQTELTTPELLDSEEKEYLDNNADSGQLFLTSRNPWRTPLANSHDAQLADRAQAAIREGDVATAKALSAEVFSRHKNYIFNRIVMLEVAVQEGATRQESIAGGLEISALAQALLAGTIPAPETVIPIPAEAYWFEISRHSFNVGDDYSHLVDESTKRPRSMDAVSYFAMSLASIPNGLDPEIDRASRIIRLCRISVCYADAQRTEMAKTFLNKALTLNEKLTRDYLNLSSDHASAQSLLPA